MFVNLMTLMHDSIKNSDKERVLEILRLKPQLRYFYDVENKSARARATEIINADIFELLLVKNLFYASESEQNFYVSLLSEEDKVKLRDINFRNARSFTEKHVMALMTMSTLGHGAENPHENFNYVHKALNVLNNIPNYKKVLELSAAAKNLQLIFDFRNEIVQYLDPTAGPCDDGSFYHNSGQIAIAAKKLLNPETEHIVYGALAHELCHFALHLLHKTKFFVDRFYIKEEMVNYYENDEKNYKNQNVINSSKILKNVEISRIFLLSDLGGEGKSTSLKNFAIKLKREFPKKWIQFVDLKNFFDEFKAENLTEIKSLEKILNFLTVKIFNLTEIERKIFNNLFISDNLIFLWDGVEENFANLFKLYFYFY